MRSTLFFGFYLFSIVVFGQAERVNRPLLEVSEKPTHILDEGVTGWSISTDGQWYSGDKMIPLRSNSYEREEENRHLREIGLDNFDRWEFRQVEYLGRQLVLWMKFSKTGSFKYSESQRGWKEIELCTYYVFSANNRPQFNLDSGATEKYVIPLLASGTIRGANRDELFDQIASKGVPSSSHAYDLIIQTQVTLSSDEVRWQIYAAHKTFDETRGIVNPMTSNSISILGVPRLFQIAYYACTPELFKSSFLE